MRWTTAADEELFSCVLGLSRPMPLIPTRRLPMADPRLAQSVAAELWALEPRCNSKIQQNSEPWCILRIRFLSRFFSHHSRLLLAVQLT